MINPAPCRKGKLRQRHAAGRQENSTEPLDVGRRRCPRAKFAVDIEDCGGIVFYEVELGDECIVGALCFIKQAEKIPARSLVVGNPSKIVKQVSEEIITWKTEGTRLYQQLAGQCFESLKPCEPLRAETDQRAKADINYKPFRKG